MKNRKIQYEPHPVSAARKAELIAGGYKILDARFAPAVQAEPSVPEAAEQAPDEEPAPHVRRKYRKA